MLGGKQSVMKHHLCILTVLTQAFIFSLLDHYSSLLTALPVLTQPPPIHPGVEFISLSPRPDLVTPCVKPSYDSPLTADPSRTCSASSPNHKLPCPLTTPGDASSLPFLQEHQPPLVPEFCNNHPQPCFPCADESCPKTAWELRVSTI